MANILLVDDEKDIVTLIQFVLVKEGHNVRTACNGVEALQEAGVLPGSGSHPMPDLILMDMLMPMMDGHTACLKLSQHPEAGKIPVLVLTARGTARDTFKDCPNVRGFVDKPFDPKSLRDTVAATAGKKA
ncbi:MAG: response regulator [Elusimicrobia bacterium]|nr:response regulator [Elusimicrobiota bacterium]